MQFAERPLHGGNEFIEVRSAQQKGEHDRDGIGVVGSVCIGAVLCPDDAEDRKVFDASGVDALPEFDIEETLVMGAFVSRKGEHMHKLCKLAGLQAELPGHHGLVGGFHVFVEILDLAEGEDIYQNPQGNIAVFRHIVCDNLMMLAHLTGDFLLNVADEFHGVCNAALAGGVIVLFFEVVIMALSGGKLVGDYGLEGVFQLQQVFEIDIAQLTVELIEGVDLVEGDARFVDFIGGGRGL